MKNGEFNRVEDSEGPRISSQGGEKTGGTEKNLFFL